MEKKKRESEKSTEQAKVWVSLVTTAIAVIAGLVSSLESAAEIFQLPWTIVVSIAASVVVTVGFTAVLARRERGPSRLAQFKDEITGAYLSALDRSPLNPARGGRR